jgi:hypothetical protein
VSELQVRGDIDGDFGRAGLLSRGRIASPAGLGSALGANSSSNNNNHDDDDYDEDNQVDIVSMNECYDSRRLVEEACGSPAVGVRVRVWRQWPGKTWSSRVG